MLSNLNKAELGDFQQLTTDGRPISLYFILYYFGYAIQDMVFSTSFYFLLKGNNGLMIIRRGRFRPSSNGVYYKIKFNSFDKLGNLA